MSIIIKGMEMPKSCSECRFAVDGWCYAYGKPNVDALSDKGRTNWCPLVPVPPYGQLIDGDALETIIGELQNQAEYYDERARQLLCESGEVSQYTWAISLRETYRRIVKALDHIGAHAIIEAKEDE